MEVEPTLHSQPLPDPHHRKIELQSPQDLIYLQSNLIASARQKLDLHFPPSAAQQPSKRYQPVTVISLDGVRPAAQELNTAHQQATQNGEATGDQQEDPMRAAIRAHVDAYISRIYATAALSITVNGLDATSLPPSTLSTKHPSPMPLTDVEASTGPKEEKEGVDFNYEAHDTRLQKRVADAYAELEALTVQVGQLRRTAPGQGAQNLGQLLTESVESEDAEFEKEFSAIKEEAAAQHDEDRAILQIEPPSKEWFTDRREMYERGRNELAALAGLGSGSEEAGDASAVQRGPGLTETVGRLQRARTVAMEFE